MGSYQEAGICISDLNSGYLENIFFSVCSWVLGAWQMGAQDQQG